jgi:hypothetical protein
MKLGSILGTLAVLLLIGGGVLFILAFRTLSKGLQSDHGCTMFR